MGSDWVIIFFIGFIFGLIIMIIIVWILYATRTFIFSNCPVGQRTCSSADYYNDPGDALAHGSSLNDILFINDNVMYYKRVPKISTCTPGSNQTVVITNPQFCFFTESSEGIGATGRNYVFNNPNYDVTFGNTATVVTTIGNCIPGNTAISGSILLEWDPNPLSLN